MEIFAFTKIFPLTHIILYGKHDVVSIALYFPWENNDKKNVEKAAVAAARISPQKGHSFGPG